ncbi:MAG: hypothetical protein A2Y12_05050 [Planctomycetes bacterium GWF2_42_9]|nr:MAG: hypothetical protein A2Y12_05050 [Planctomycetes bacterium GWF2_42_9]
MWFGPVTQTYLLVVIFEPLGNRQRFSFLMSADKRFHRPTIINKKALVFAALQHLFPHTCHFNLSLSANTRTDSPTSSYSLQLHHFQAASDPLVSAV